MSLLITAKATSPSYNRIDLPPKHFAALRKVYDCAYT